MVDFHPDRPSGIVLLAGLSAILMALSFPKAAFWPAAFVCLAPFFIVLNISKKMKDLILAGAVFGSVTAIAMGYWLYPTLTVSYETSFLTGTIFMTLGLTLPLAILFTFFSLAYGFVKSESLFFHALAVPSLWVLFEYLKESAPGSVPWAHIGYALSPWKAFIQGADLWGVYGVSFLVVMVNSLISPIVIGVFQKKWTFRPLLTEKKLILPILIGAVLVFPTLYGAIKIDSIETSINSALGKGAGIPIRIVQGNFGSRERWQGSGFYDRIMVYSNLSRFDEARNSLIIWPETVLNASGKVNTELFGYLLSSLGEGNVLIAGGVRSAPGGVHNSAFIFSRDRGVHWYDKNILLPHAEKVLFSPLLGRYYSAPAEFIAGTTPSTVMTSSSTPSISICFESLYPWYVRRGVTAGADILVNLSNDAWFGDSPEPYIHLYSAAFRCIEHRRYMARASNSGISAIINPAGKIVKRTGLFNRNILNGKIIPMRDRTLYTRFGDWILYLAALVILADLTVIVIGSRKQT